MEILSPTIQNLVLSRLIRISEGARRVVEAAAVIGREFTFELVQRSLLLSEVSLSETAILDCFDELEGALIIQPQGHDRFTFDHSLTMETALQDMSASRQRFLHRKVAQALEELHRNQLDSIAGLLAYHFNAAGLPAQAGTYALRAGRYAASLAAWAEAIQFFEQALSTETDPGKQAAICNLLGKARFHKGDFIPASQAFFRAIELARASADIPDQEAAYLGLATSFMPQSRFREAVSLARDLETAGQPEMAICAQFIWGVSLSVESAHPNEAEIHLRQALRLLDDSPDYHGVVTQVLIHYQLAGVVGQQGKSAEAVALYQQALEVVRMDRSALDLLRRIMLFNGIAYQMHLLGDPAAIDYAEEGIRLAQETGSLTHLPYLLSTCGEIALGQSRLDEAEHFFAEGLVLARQAPVPERIAGMTANLALVSRERGELTIARERLSEALLLADELGVNHLAVRIRCWLAPLLPSNDAQVILQQAHTIAEQSGFQSLLEEITALEQQV
jgi:tetratricopeptide (TPR) repeat protein